MRVFCFVVLALLSVYFLPIASSQIIEEEKIVEKPDNLVTITAKDRGLPRVSFENGTEITSSANQNGSPGKLMATADFNSDGIADLIVSDTGGNLKFYPGNIQSIYPTGKMGDQSLKDEDFSAEAFLPIARNFQISIVPDFLETGDFNADGNQDILAARKNDSALYLAAGDGAGNFADSVRIEINGTITAIVVGEIGRADGQTDVAVGIAGKKGSSLLIFEHPEGAFTHEPENFKLSSSANNLIIGNLDTDFFGDVAVASGNKLTVVRGRGQIFPWDSVKGYDLKRPAAIVESRVLPFEIAGLASGYFTERRGESLAMLTTAGEIQILDSPTAEFNRSALKPQNLSKNDISLPVKESSKNLKKFRKRVEKVEPIDLMRQIKEVDISEEKQLTAEQQKSLLSDAPNLTPELRNRSIENFLRTNAPKNSAPLARWNLQTIFSDARLASAANSLALSKLVKVRVSDSGRDELAFIDSSRNQIHLMIRENSKRNRVATANEIVSLDVEGSPVNLIPMRLNSDALSDLVILREGSSIPSVVMTAPAQTFVVTTADDEDDGFCGATCSLREAINAANDSSGADAINFNIGGGAFHLLQPDTALPVIESTITIDARTQPGFSSQPLIEIKGNLVGEGYNGLSINASNVVVRGLAINEFRSAETSDGREEIKEANLGGTGQTGGNGIAIYNFEGETSAAYCIIEGNYLGTDSTGALDRGNDQAGLNIFDSDNNTVGGTTALARNVISGNGDGEIPYGEKFGYGLSITDGRNSLITGNYIGTNANGSSRVGNSTGIFLSGMNNRIGTDSVNSRNVISGNTHSAPSTFDNTGCYGGGIGEGSLVNVETGEWSTAENSFKANLIGLAANGNAPVSNCRTGIFTSPRNTATIGSFVEAGRNTVSGNTDGGVFCSPVARGAGNLLIEENLGTDVPEGFCRIVGNNIGTNAGGNFAIANDHRHGDQIFAFNGALVVYNTLTFSTVGGTTGTSANSCTGNCNLISGNGTPGIYEVVPGITRYGNFGDVGIWRNFVGTNKTGTAGVPNYSGISAIGGNTNIGGVLTGQPSGNSSLGNLISGNLQSAVSSNPGREGGFHIHQVLGNLIGTDASGVNAVPNVSSENPVGSAMLFFSDGIAIVGGEELLERNIVSGNKGTGMIFGTGILTAPIVNNYIGVNKNGAPLGNLRDGIELWGSYDYIGDAGAGNVIANNGRSGVAVTQPSAFGNRIRFNSIYNNGGLGIDLSADATPPNEPDGVTENDCQDIDTGANDLQNYPVLSAPVFNQNGTVSVEGGLQSTPDKTFTIDFYSNDSADPTNYGEGQTHIGSLTTTTDDFYGLATFQFNSSVTVSPTAKITATATDIDGNTSEFSCFAGECIADASLVERMKNAATGNGGFTCAVPLVVNVTDDRPDPSPENNICDVDLETDGLQCSLRGAIQTVNAVSGADIVNFDIPGNDQVIKITSLLPPITEQVLMDASTQSGYNGSRPFVEVKGVNPDGSPLLDFGLKFAAGSNQSQIRALSIHGFNSGVVFESNENTIEKCFIGMNMFGLENDAEGMRQQTGILVRGSGNIIGGIANESGNLLSGNVVYQLEIRGANATGNVVHGNSIGYNISRDRIESGTGIVSVGITGGASQNEIGGASEQETNEITSTGIGIRIAENSNQNKIQRNIIERTVIGIIVLDSSDNQIGGERTSFENSPINFLGQNETNILIDGESNGRSVFNAIRAKHQNVNWNLLPKRNLGGAVSARNKIQGNIIAVIDPKIAVPLQGIGVGVGIAEDTLIGGEEFNLGNFIGDQTEAGIVVRKESAGTIIRSNYVGMNPEGTIRANRDGIRLGGSNAQIVNNRISGNTATGINIDRLENSDPAPTGNIIRLNRVGTDPIGNAPRGNDTGISISGEQNTITDNLISGNTVAGIVLYGNQNTIYQNKIGTNLTGDAAITQTAGLSIESSFNTVDANTISGNQTGIVVGRLSDGQTTPGGNKIVGNFIGTNSNGTAAIPNTLDGIQVGRSATTLIGGFGGAMPLARNIISGNGRHGIALFGALNTRISGNYIGTNVNGTSALGNVENGIFIAQGTGNTIIGGTENAAGNTIAYNGKNGILAAVDAGNNNIIDPNSIFGNVDLGIDLGGDGHTPNDPADADSGPNNLQNYPQIVSRSIVGNELIVNFKVDSAPSNSSYGANGIYVEFFKADASGEGEKFLGFAYYMATDYNNGSPQEKSVNLGNMDTLGITTTDKITATATDALGNTSEFTPVFIPTAANVSISGRAVRQDGIGIGNAKIVLTDSNGVAHRAITNSFGLYNFENLEAGNTYVLSISHKRYSFAQSVRVLSVNDDLTDIDFVGTSVY